MRCVASVVFYLIAAVSPVSANTLTLSDAGAANRINGSLLAAVKDINQARKGMIQANDFSANSVCVEEIQHNLIIVQSDVEHLAALLLIDAQMTDTGDEVTVLNVTKIEIDQFLTEAPDIRAEMNRLSGVCSRFPLPVAKALQSIGLIDQAIALVKSISQRLH